MTKYTMLMPMALFCKFLDMIIQVIKDLLDVDDVQKSSTKERHRIISY